MQFFLENCLQQITNRLMMGLCTCLFTESHTTRICIKIALLFKSIESVLLLLFLLLFFKIYIFIGFREEMRRKR